MALFVASLNSGSNGNCYYIGNNEEGILVDAGIRCKEIENRMEGLGLEMSRVKALFITHEHTDHISGIPTLVKKYRLPVYITSATYRGCGFSIDPQLICSFSAFEPVIVGAISVTAFPKYHDAADPHSVIVSFAGVTVGVFTDIGEPCKNVIQYFKQCHAIFLEANYDDAMLANGRYPVFLKRRISGRQGHLSNEQALQLFISHRSSFLTHVFLSHLSRENNHPDTAKALFDMHAGAVNIVHAPRDGATAVYQIIASAQNPIVPPMPVAKKRPVKAQLQLSLFS